MRSKASTSKASTCVAKVRVWAGSTKHSEKVRHLLRHAIAEDVVGALGGRERGASEWQPRDARPHTMMSFLRHALFHNVVASAPCGGTEVTKLLLRDDDCSLWGRGDGDVMEES